MVAAGNDALWANFCRAIDIEPLCKDDRLTTNPLINENYDELRPILTKIMKIRTTQEWQNILDNAGVPNGPINTVDKVVARDMIIEIDHPISGTLKVTGIPIKLAKPLENTYDFSTFRSTYRRNIERAIKL